MKNKISLLTIFFALSGSIIANQGQTQKTEAPKTKPVISDTAPSAPVEPKLTAIDTLNMNMKKLERVPEKIDAIGVKNEKTRNTLIQTDIILDSISSNVVTAKPDTQKIIIIRKDSSFLAPTSESPVPEKRKRKSFFQRINPFQ